MAFQRIDVDEAKTLMDEQGALVVDVRDPMSFQAGHIPGSTLVSDENIDEFLQGADKSRPLIVCCYHGNMSQGAAEYFNQKGFGATYSLDGGFEAWLQVS